MILISDMIHYFEDIYTFTPDFEFLSDKEKEKRKESYQNKLNNLSNRCKLAETQKAAYEEQCLHDFAQHFAHQE